MISDVNAGTPAWQAICPPDDTRCAIQGLAGENNVSSHIFGFIERVIRSFQGAIDIGIYERRHADTNGDIGRDAFIEHMRDFQIVDPLPDSLRGLKGVFRTTAGQ